MKSWKVLLGIGILVTSLSLGGCGGGGANVKARTTTVGQELMDLDAAYKAGIITEREYKQKKEHILKSE